MIFLKNEDIINLLEWEGLVAYVEKALEEISTTENRTVPPRTIITVDQPALSLYCMPSYSAANNVASCKLITQCPDNQVKYNMPSISGVVIVFNVENGKLDAVLEAETLTEWRTAAGSIVAAKHLWSCSKEKCKDKTLTVLGAGKQGETHIKAFQALYKFKTVNLWNRTESRALATADRLKADKIFVNVFIDAKKSVQDADLVIWAASATPEIYIESENLKKGAFVISVGTSAAMPSGLGGNIFQNGELYTESVISARSEMAGFIAENGLEFYELGQVIAGRKIVSEEKRIVYQSLGSGMMDAAAGKFILEKHKHLDR